MPSGTEKIINFPDRERTPEERETEKKKILAYDKTLRGRWRLFWQYFNHGRTHWRHSSWRVWGTDSQGQQHNLGMASTETAAEAIEECRGISAHLNPIVLTYEISVTQLPQHKFLAERLGNLFHWPSFRFVVRAFRVVIFVALLYEIDHTPLDIYRLVSYFHLNNLEGWFLAIFGLVVLWKAANWITGFLLLMVFLVIPHVEQPKRI